jgi:hypothetical protein
MGDKAITFENVISKYLFNSNKDHYRNLADIYNNNPVLRQALYLSLCAKLSMENSSSEIYDTLDDLIENVKKDEIDKSKVLDNLEEIIEKIEVAKR